jgi:secondary thiamine-phosphate synthase enzyme
LPPTPTLVDKVLLLFIFLITVGINMGWQKTFSLPRRSKGCHLVTDEVLAQISDGIKDVKIGMLFLFIQHTSAALSINENFDSDVRRDMDMALDTIVPETLEWRHTDEGQDDSVSHTKATLVGSTISVPITNGSLNLGTWQGIYLAEFRHVPHTRRVVATVLS